MRQKKVSKVRRLKLIMVLLVVSVYYFNIHGYVREAYASSLYVDSQSEKGRSEELRVSSFHRQIYISSISTGLD